MQVVDVSVRVILICCNTGNEPARGLVASGSASVLADLEFDSRPALTKTFKIGTVAFLPGARFAEELQGLHRTQQTPQ